MNSRPSSAAAASVVVFSLFASALAAYGVPQTKPATGPGSVATKGPCRTYDTSVTSVTTGGPMKVTVEISGVFDPWSLRMVQNVSYDSNQGGRFQIVQTSTWDTAEDFIAEVIRLKPPAGLPINPGPNPPPAKVNDIIPPLLRSRSTIGNGQIWFTKVNYFDTTNRLQSFNSRVAAGVVSVTYSAWDSTGRPTAGTMKGPQSTSTISISYDDVALTQTETTTTMGITSTITTKYDENGNIRLSTATVTRGTPSQTVWTPHSQATVCLLDLRAAPKPPTKPLGPNPNGSFTATINGASFSGSLGLKAENNGAVAVGAGDGHYLVSIGVAAKAGPGEYKAGPPPDTTDWKNMTAQQFKDMMDHNTVVATVWDTQTKQGWQASPTIGKGSVNLTSIAGSAAGSFSLTLEPIAGTGASGSITFNGSFNVKY